MQPPGVSGEREGKARAGGSVLDGQLDRAFRLVAFFDRVPLEDLALVYPEARTCATKAEFIRSHLETLRALVRLGLLHRPAAVGRLLEEFPEVSRLLRVEPAATVPRPAPRNGPWPRGPE